MPLVLIMGHPGAGKSTLTAVLADTVRERLRLKGDERQVGVVSDESVNASFERELVYNEPRREKDHRGLLRSEVSKLLASDTVVLLDSLSYVKGFRYELFCAVKGVRSTLCVVEVTGTPDVLHSREIYSRGTLDELLMRYEAPEAKNRWDSPLIKMDAEVTEVERRRVADESQALAQGNFLHDLDALTRSLTQAYYSAQASTLSGEDISLPGTDPIAYSGDPMSLAALSRIRRQFVAYTKSHPPPREGMVPGLFAAYLRSQLTL